MTQLELLIDDNYFKGHESHIMGEKGTKSTRWGEEIAIVHSDEAVEDIAKRIIGKNYVPEIQPWHLAIKTGTVKTKGEENQLAGDDVRLNREKAIQEAIAKTKHFISNPPSATDLDLISFEELQQRWGTKLSKDELAVWVWYQRGRLFSDSAILSQGNGWGKYVTPHSQEKQNIRSWIDKGLIAFDGTEYIPSTIFYAGNINRRIQKLETHIVAAEKELGKAGLEKQKELLLKALPERLKISANESERLFISPLDPFVTQNRISVLSDGTVLDGETTLLDAFLGWIDTLSAEDFKYNSNSYEIESYWLGNKQFKRDTDENEKIEIRRRSQQDGMNLFSRFMFEMLTREDQQVLETIWNNDYNSFVEYDYSRIPVGFEMNRIFKAGPIDPKPVLWDGVKFLTANGSGVVAFDVGVGKTMCAILAMAQALYTGQCKRPLVVVPNPTYKKWIEETVGRWNKDGTIAVNGILPQYRDRINDFYNLGVDVEENLTKQWPKDYTITFVTYEGLAKMGFSKKARTVIEEQLYAILNQGLDKRDKEKMREDIDKILGDITASTIANFDDLGFDYIVIDEAHNFKNIFTRVKGRVEEESDERQQSPYQLSSGTPSARGLKGFAVCQWILKNNDMRNVVLLTATPFTNSPLEIYSILSLVAYQKLEKRGIENLSDFFDKFILEQSELSVTVRGKLEERRVIKNYQNRQVLQNIIFSSIIYRTGAEANVKRPVKVVYPLLKDGSGILLPPDKRIETQLKPTKDQSYWLRAIAQFANNEAGNVIEQYIPESMYDKNDRLQGRDLLAISLAKSVTLSPYLLHVAGNKLFSDAEPTYLEYVESSPKLQYTMGCIKTIREWHESRNEPISGVVIYMNLGTEYFDRIQKYLENKIGYKKDEVQIIMGGIEPKKKEAIKEKFLNGEVKVIIGSATIKEGIDLQTRSTCLFNLNLDWNPTDIQQLEGRIWRQGNIHSYVRIITPLIENSLDVFMFQKLEEKTSRINDIWYRAGRGNVLKLEDFDPKELKMGLMTDPKERVIAEIKIEVQKLEGQKSIADSTVNKIGEARKAIEALSSGWEQIDSYYKDARKSLQIDLETVRLELTEPELSKTKTDELTAREKSLSTVLGYEENEKTKIAIVKRYANALNRKRNGYDWNALRMINLADAQSKNMALIEAITKNVLTPRGLTISDDLDPIVIEASTESELLANQMELIKSKSWQEARIEKVREEMEARQRESKSTPERIKEFTRQNYLLSCVEKTTRCSLDTNVIERIVEEPVEVEPKKEKAQPAPSDDKVKRIRIAKAKAAALKIKFQFEELKKAA